MPVARWVWNSGTGSFTSGDAPSERDRHRHHLAVRRDVEDLLAVARPADLRAAGGRHLRARSCPRETTGRTLRRGRFRWRRTPPTCRPARTALRSRRAATARRRLARLDRWSATATRSAPLFGVVAAHQHVLAIARPRQGHAALAVGEQRLRLRRRSSACRAGPPPPKRREKKTTCWPSGSQSGCASAGGPSVMRRARLRASSITQMSLSPRALTETRPPTARRHSAPARR